MLGRARVLVLVDHVLVERHRHELPACGSIHVDTNVARLSRALPSSMSSSRTSWYATSGSSSRLGSVWRGACAFLGLLCVQRVERDGLLVGDLAVQCHGGPPGSVQSGRRAYALTGMKPTITTIGRPPRRLGGSTAQPVVFPGSPVGPVSADGRLLNRSPTEVRAGWASPRTTRHNRPTLRRDLSRRSVRVKRKRTARTHGFQRDPRAQARHDPGLGRGEPGHPGDRHRGRALSRRAAEDARARRVRGGAARVRRDQAAAADEARARAPRDGRRAGATPPRRAAGRRPRRLRGRSGDRGRRVRCRASGSTSPASPRARASPARCSATTSRVRARRTATTRSTAPRARSAPAPRRPACSRA